MHVVNQVVPQPGQLESFFDVEASGPIAMINLLRFRERAQYPDGDRGLSGAQAYALYAGEVVKLIAEKGGSLVYGGRITGVLVGEVEELWDTFALVEYPSNAAFRAMMETEEYQRIAVHRTAGLAGQLDIRVQGRPAKA